MTTLSDRVEVEAQRVDVGRLLLTAFAAVFYALGWLVGRAVAGTAFAIGAARVGYSDGRKTRGTNHHREATLR